MQFDKFRLCVCYLVSTVLISLFVYSLISNNLQNKKKLERLKEDVDEIAHLVLHTPPSGKEPKHLTDVVDNMIKKRLAGIWDDLYAIKKSIRSGKECSGIDDVTGTTKVKSEGTLLKAEERINYAAEELGAAVVQIKAEAICPLQFFKSWMGMDFASNPPIRMLRSTMEPGSCFAYKYDKADVTIRLAHEILVEQISLQHITKEQSPTGDTSSAPKDFHLFGIHGDFSEYSLGKYRFDNNAKRPLQYFNIVTNDRLEFLRFQFESNHGHPNYTCIYRVAVYGKF